MEECKNIEWYQDPEKCRYCKQWFNKDFLEKNNYNCGQCNTENTEPMVKLEDRLNELKSLLRMNKAERIKTVYTLDAKIEQIENEIDFLECNILK